MSNIFESIKQWLARHTGGTSPQERQKEALVQGLMTALQMTRDNELGCDEIFEVIDQYAEAIMLGVDTEQLMPLVHHHIAMCGECREELEMLLEMMKLQAA